VWRYEYARGQGKEMYTVSLPELLVPATSAVASVSAIAVQLYCRSGVLLIGVCRGEEVLVGTTAAGQLQHGDCGLVIADDIGQAEAAVSATWAACK
jgi:hypothetical protein